MPESRAQQSRLARLEELGVRLEERVETGDLKAAEEGHPFVCFVSEGV